MARKTTFADNPDGWRNALRRVVELLERHNLRYFIYGGTLLGWQRDGEFIPWDNDIDIGIYGTEADKLVPLLKEMLSLGWKRGRWGKWGIKRHGNFSAKRKIEVGGVTIDSGPRIRMMHLNNVRVDLIVHYKIGDYYYRSLNRRTNRIYRLPAIALDETSTYNYNGNAYVIPAGWETVLEWEYGPDWQTPERRNHGHARTAKQFYQELPLK